MFSSTCRGPICHHFLSPARADCVRSKVDQYHACLGAVKDWTKDSFQACLSGYYQRASFDVVRRLRARVERHNAGKGHCELRPTRPLRPNNQAQKKEEKKRKSYCDPQLACTVPTSIPGRKSDRKRGSRSNWRRQAGTIFLFVAL